MGQYANFYNSRNGDRVYNADSMSEWLLPFFTTGVFNNCFAVTATGDGMNISVGGGYVNIKGKVASHLYAADRLKRRLVRKIRLAYDLGYSAMNKDAYFYCAKQTGAIGAQIGGLIKSIAENKRK